MKILYNLLLGKKQNKIPVWFMRQAGRYLPEYKETRKLAGSFLNLCYNPKLAAEVTIQPIKRFDLDAAIIFADILLVPDILGLKLEFLEGEGPKLESVKRLEDINKLKIKNVEESEKMQIISSSLQLVKEILPKEKTLIGFAGSPWTVSTYIISDKKHDFDYCRKFAYEKKDVLKELINVITEQTIIYLKNQIDSGAEILQLFDSWSSVLIEKQFEDLVIEPTKKIVTELKKYSPSTPIIGFPKGAGLYLEDYINATKIDAIGLDHFVPLKYAKNLQDKIIVQGNLDPMVLFLDQQEIKMNINRILSSLDRERLIFNLGHGIMQHTPVENVEYAISCVRNYRG